MKKVFKFYTLAALAAALTFTACSDDNDATVDGGSDDDVMTVLPSEITEDLTIEAGNYTISGAVHVKAGATLTIEPGVTVIAEYDNVLDYLMIEQGAKIYAVGTASNPIVMTAIASDGWGGIHLCGYAPINGDGSESEIGECPYGGDDENDNSGTMKYVRVENSGKTISSEKEANGFSFYGVGAGTTVSYCQAYGGSDDGFEFFGGTVNIDHCVVVDCTDDSFDWTQGWRGSADHILAVQTTGSGCDCLMECDNSGSDNARVPVARPTIKNATLIGDGDGKGARFREGTQVEFYNSIIMNTANSMIVEADYTNASFTNNWSALTLSADYEAYKEQSIAQGIALDNVMSATSCDLVAPYTTEAFLAAGNGENQTFTANADYYYVLSTDVAPVNGASYVGAFNPSATPWTDGAWCVID